MMHKHRRGAEQDPALDHVLSVANSAYHDGEANLTDPMRTGIRDDTLADFIRLELMDVAGEALRAGESRRQAMAQGACAIQTAVRELQAVQNALLRASNMTD